MRAKSLLTSVASLSAIVGLFVALTATPARAVPIEFTAALTGPGESPPNASPGTGFADVFFDTAAHTLRVIVDFTGLLGTTTASHIHCCTTIPFTGAAAVATTTPTFAGFPLGVTSGHYDNTLDMTLASSYNAPFLASAGSTAAAEIALLNGAFAGTEYLNVHSSFATGGEIRGFLAPIPEPGTLTLLATALAGFGLLRRRRRELI